MLLCSNSLFRWWHEDTSSLRLLSVDNSGQQMISNFSLRERLHLFLGLFKCEIGERMRHEIKWSMFPSLSFQISLLN